MDNLLAKEFVRVLHKDNERYVGAFGAKLYHPYEIIETNELFMTLNYFKPETSRAAKNVIGLNGLFFDLDTVKEANLEPAEAWVLICSDVFEKGLLPYPTVVVNSGAGLHIYYKFTQVMSTDKLKTWKKLENSFCEVLKDYGPDHACVEPARVLRIPGTINEKHGNIVSALYINENNKYDFYWLCKNYICGDNQKPPTDKQLQEISSMERALGKEFPKEYKATFKNADKTIQKHFEKYKNIMNSQPVSKKQEAFIRKICKKMHCDYPELKGEYDAYCFIKKRMPIMKSNALYENYSSRDERTAFITLRTIQEYVYANSDSLIGMREHLLFVVRVCATFLYGEEDGLEEVYAVNALFNNPCTETFINVKTRNALGIDYQGYIYFSVRVASEFITGDKYEFDDYIPKKDPEERNEQKRDNEKIRYAEKIGNKWKKDKLKECYEFIKAHPDYTVKQLAKELNVTERTVKNYKRTIKDFANVCSNTEGG